MLFEDLEEFKKLVIIALFSDADLMQTFVLKGGNLLDVVYGISSRPSIDIDLSMCGEFTDMEKARASIEKALRACFTERGYIVFDVTLREEPHSLTDDMKEFWGGYKVDFKVIGNEAVEELSGDQDGIRRRAVIVRSDGGTKFPIEISKYEYCDEKEERVLDGCSVYVYTPTMLVCEKLRAICQQMPEYAQLVKRTGRPRGRDFLDIHTVTEYFRLDFGHAAFQETLRKVFLAKRVPLRLLGSLGTSGVREFHRPDFVSVVDTLKPNFDVQSYDYYHDYVAAKCRMLEPLWNE